MAIDISQQISLNAQVAIEPRHGPFSSVATAISKIPYTRRHLGLTVFINTEDGIVEYWFKRGITNDHFIPKTNDSSISYKVIEISSSIVDLSVYPDVNIFYIIVSSDITISSIIPPNKQEFTLVFSSINANSVIIKDRTNFTPSGSAVTINTGEIDSEFIANGKDWWIGRVDTINDKLINQINGYSSTFVEGDADGETPVAENSIQVVPHLPITGEENVTYIVTTVTPNPMFRWHEQLETFVQVGSKESTLSVMNVDVVIDTNLPKVSTHDWRLMYSGRPFTTSTKILIKGQVDTRLNGIYGIDIRGEGEVSLNVQYLKRLDGLTINGYKNTIFKVISGEYKDSIYISNIKQYDNANSIFYQGGNNGAILGTIGITFELVYTPTSILNKVESILTNYTTPYADIESAFDGLNETGNEQYAEIPMNVTKDYKTSLYAHILNTNIIRGGYEGMVKFRLTNVTPGVEVNIFAIIRGDRQPEYHGNDPLLPAVPTTIRFVHGVSDNASNIWVDNSSQIILNPIPNTDTYIHINLKVIGAATSVPNAKPTTVVKYHTVQKLLTTL